MIRTIPLRVPVGTRVACAGASRQRCSQQVVAAQLAREPQAVVVAALP